MHYIKSSWLPFFYAYYTLAFSHVTSHQSSLEKFLAPRSSLLEYSRKYVGVGAASKIAHKKAIPQKWLCFSILAERRTIVIFCKKTVTLCVLCPPLCTHRHINMPITNTFGCTDGSNDRRSSSEVL